MISSQRTVIRTPHLGLAILCRQARDQTLETCTNTEQGNIGHMGIDVAVSMTSEEHERHTHASKDLVELGMPLHSNHTGRHAYAPDHAARLGIKEY